MITAFDKAVDEVAVWAIDVSTPGQTLGGARGLPDWFAPSLPVQAEDMLTALFPTSRGMDNREPGSGLVIWIQEANSGARGTSFDQTTVAEKGVDQ